MSEHSEETRDTGTLEDQSAKAAKKAKDAALEASKANDAAALAKAELVRSKAEAAYHTAQQEAKRAKDTAEHDLPHTIQQRESATNARRHCDSASEKSRQEVVDATVHYTNLKIDLERAEAKMKAATAMATVKSEELTAALKLEADLKAKVADLETASQTYDLAIAAAKVTRSAAESDYAQEVAKIKKAAADRHMASFAS